MAETLSNLDPSSVLPAQPAASKITFLSQPDSLTFIVPRSGFHGTAAFFLKISLVVTAVAGTAGTVMAIHELRHSSLLVAILSLLIPAMVCTLFLLISLGTFLASIQLAFRKAVLVTSRDCLVFTQTGPLRNREFQWPHDQLTAIRSADSTTSVNNNPLRELRIESGQSEPCSLFAGRDPEELEWIAATLRSFYSLPASKEPQPLSAASSPEP